MLIVFVGILIRVNYRRSMKYHVDIKDGIRDMFNEIYKDIVFGNKKI